MLKKLPPPSKMAKKWPLIPQQSADARVMPGPIFNAEARMREAQKQSQYQYGSNKICHI